MKTGNYIALTLVIIGALNWGLIGFFGFDLVTTIFGGSMFWLARVIFALVGFTAQWRRNGKWYRRPMDSTKNTGGIFYRHYITRRIQHAFYKNGRLRQRLYLYQRF